MTRKRSKLHKFVHKTGTLRHLTCATWVNMRIMS